MQDPAIPPMTPDEVEEALKQFDKGYTKFVEGLSPFAREYFRNLCSGYLEGDTAGLEALNSIDYDNNPLDPRTFFTHPDYLGHFSTEVYEAWWPHIFKMSDPSHHVREIILTGSFGLGKCCAAGTYINTNRGTLPIEEVKAGDMVEGFTGQNEVYEVHNEGDTEVVTIKATEACLSARPNHRIKVLTQKGELEWRQMRELYHLAKEGGVGALPKIPRKYRKGAGALQQDYTSINSISSGRAHCYDLSTSGDHSYVSNGFISHNTTIGAGMIVAYFLHRILCLKNPAKFYGLGKKSKIVFGIYSLSLESAEDAGFFVLRDQMLSESPFFTHVYRGKSYGDEEIVFPKHICVKTGSKTLHAAGKNLFAICVDEMNLMAQGKSTTNKAFELAMSVSRRLKSRFMQRGGHIPGAAIFLGSAASESSFLEKRIRAHRTDPSVYVVQGALWDFVKYDTDGKPIYSGDVFRVQVGNGEFDSRVLDEVKRLDEDSFEILEVEEPNAECQIVDVPAEHYAEFYQDPDGALQDIAGVSTKTSMKLLPSAERLRQCISTKLSNPISQTVIPAFVGGIVELHNEIIIEKMCRILEGRYIPRRHPAAPRYIHVDLAKNLDRAGFAMVHPSSNYISVEVDETNEEGMAIYDVHKNIEVDLALAVCAGPQGQSIDFAKIRRLIFHLRSMGFWIRKVTYDSWQSEDSIQRLTDASIKADVKSVDKDPFPYGMLRNCVVACRIKMPMVELLKTELLCLEVDPLTNRVDHPLGETKDVADGVAGATYQCLIDKIKPTEARDGRQNVQESKKAQRYKEYLSTMQEAIHLLE